MVDISIILATRNEEKYIGNTLSKLVDAGNEAGKHGIDTEIIVVDNSTDETFRKARKYVKNVYAFSPPGVSKARNFGAKLAKGEILVFMDADTTLQKVSLVDVAKEFMDTRVVSAVSRVLPSTRRNSLSAVLFYELDGLYVRSCAYLKALLRFYNRGDLTAVRKDVFERIRGFNEKLHMLEITELLMKVSSFGRVTVLPSPVFESSRRLRQWGLLKSYKVWWRNYFCFYVFGRLCDSKYEACRGKN
jgi:glycosyltransferase involved in cell wall biosynthesis